MIYVVLVLLIIIIIGGVLFWLLGSKKKEYNKETFKNISVTTKDIKHNELGLFVAIASKITKADLRDESLVSEILNLMLSDISAVFPEPQKTRNILRNIFNEQKDIDDNVQPIANALAEAVKKDTVRQQEFIEFLAQIAYLDGETIYEEDVLATVSKAFGRDANMYHKIIDQFKRSAILMKQKTKDNDIYKTLEVAQNDSLAVVTASYKKLIKRHHLNIIDAQNSSDTFDATYGEYYIVASVTKLEEIQQAYQKIKREKSAKS